MKRTILLVTLGVALYSCQTNKAVLNSEYIGGNTYSGTMPCSNCAEKDQVIIQDTSIYVDTDNESVEKHANWSAEDGKVMLNADNVNIAQYAVTGNKLIHLSKTNLVTRKKGQLKAVGVAKKNFIRSKKINPDYLEGVDIVAFGAASSWSLDIHHKNDIQFSVAGIEAPITFSSVIPTLSGDSIIYNLISSNEKMQVVLSPGFCSDETGENLYDYQVTIQFRDKSYSGCGAIVNADGNLTGVWVFDNLAEGKNNWEKQPYIVVDLDAETFYANTGCNNISGSARMRGARICFSDINYNSQKDCEGYDEKGFMDAVIKCNGYTIDQGKLSLMQNGRTVMTFTRHVEK